MARTASSSSRQAGFSLVEILIALTILMIVMFALMSAAVLSMQSNIRNTVRDNAALATQDELAMLRSKPFAQIVSQPTKVVTKRAGNQFYSYSVTLTVTNPDPGFACIQATTTWVLNQKNYIHTATTVVRQ